MTRGGNCPPGSSLRAPVTAPTCPFRPPQPQGSYAGGCQGGPIGSSICDAGTCQNAKPWAPSQKANQRLRSRVGPALSRPAGDWGRRHMLQTPCPHLWEQS